MSPLSKPISVAGIDVETVSFPPAAIPPGSTDTLFLGGAGVRGLDVQGKFTKFTVIGVYLQDSVVPSLAVKWKGKTAQELTESVEFFRDIVTGPFEKFMRVTYILPLTGIQFCGKVTENCIAYMKSVGAYNDVEARAVDKFLEAFKDQNFLSGSSVFFTQSPLGLLMISFSKDGSIPRASNAVIENKQLSEAVLETMIGKNGVSPAAKLSLASRLSELLKDKAETNETPLNKAETTEQPLELNGKC